MSLPYFNEKIKKDLAEKGWIVPEGIELGYDSENRIWATGDASKESTICTPRTRNSELDFGFGVFVNVGFALRHNVSTWDGFPTEIRLSDYHRMLKRSPLILDGHTPALKDCPIKGYTELRIDSGSNIASFIGLEPGCIKLRMIKCDRIKNFEGVSKNIRIIEARHSAIESLYGLDKGSEMITMDLENCPIKSLEYCPRLLRSLDIRGCSELRSLKGISINTEIIARPIGLEPQYNRYLKMRDMMANEIKKWKTLTNLIVEDPRKWIEMAIDLNLRNMEFFFNSDLPDKYRENEDAYRGAIEWS